MHIASACDRRNFVYLLTILFLAVVSSSSSFALLLLWFRSTSKCSDIDSASFSNSASFLRSTTPLPGLRLRDRIIGFIAIILGFDVFDVIDEDDVAAVVVVVVATT